MLKRYALALLFVFAASALLSAPAGDGAMAQTWKPKTRRQKPAAEAEDSKPAADKKPRKKARRKPAKKPRRKAREKADERREQREREEKVVDEPGDDDEEVWGDDGDAVVDEPGDDDAGAKQRRRDDEGSDRDDDWGDGDDDDDWGDDDDDDDWGDDDASGATARPKAAGGAVVIRDDLDDIGPDAKIDKADLVTDAAAGAGTTRLETRALAFASTHIDVVHDAVPDPEAVSGLRPNGEDVLSFRLHGRAAGTGRFGRNVKVKVAGRFDADLAIDSDTNFNTQRYEGRVWDTYADIYSSWLDLRVGNQLVAWGTADLLSPNDVVNARDLRRGFLDHPDELRVPTLALSLTAHDGPFEAQLLYVPVAPVNRFELLEGDYALLGPHGATALERKVGAIVAALRDDPMLGLALQPILSIGSGPDHGVETGELGASVGLRFRKLDVFGYAFWGHERNPRIEMAPGLLDLFETTTVNALDAAVLTARVNELAAMGITSVTADYPRKLHVGGAFATRLEPIGFKVDVGYTLGSNVVLVPPGEGPLLGVPAAHDVGSGTVSFDYNRGDQLTVILEASLTRVFGVDPARDVYQFDSHELLVFGGRFQWSPGQGPLQLRFLGFVEGRDQLSYALRPALRLSGHDNLALELAGAIYGGPPTSLGGIQDRNDEVQILVQYGL